MAETASVTAESTVTPHEQAEAILADMGFVDHEETDEASTEPDGAEPSETAPAEPAAADAQKEPAPEAPPAPEEWAKTPEGISAKAAEVQKQLELVSKERADFQRKHDMVEQRERKLKTSVSRFKKERDEHRVFADWVTTNINALRNGDAATKVQALGALTGRPGHEAYEDLTIGIVSDGKAPGRASPELQSAMQRIEQLEEVIRTQQQQGRMTAEQRHVQTWRENMVKLSQSEATPLCSKMAAADPDDYADQAQRVAQAYFQQNGRPMAPAQVAAAIEQRLQKLAVSLVPAQPQGEGAAPSDGGTSPGIVAQAKPGTARSSPRGSSIPQTAGTAARTRPLTQAERLKQAEDLVPGYALAKLASR